MSVRGGKWMPWVLRQNPRVFGRQNRFAAKFWRQNVFGAKKWRQNHVCAKYWRENEWFSAGNCAIILIFTP
jgi:hypothetical protein